MYTTTMTQPDPELFMKQFLTEEQATKANKWQGRNITRWSNKEYDDNWKAGQDELDPVKRAAIFIKANDMVVNNYVVIPVVARPGVVAISQKLTANISGWDNNTWDIQDWFKEA
jgi:peptide/nickel transport system substrate-binding protein